MGEAGRGLQKNIPAVWYSCIMQRHQTLTKIMEKNLSNSSSLNSLVNNVRGICHYWQLLIFMHNNRLSLITGFVFVELREMILSFLDFHSSYLN